MSASTLRTLLATPGLIAPEFSAAKAYVPGESCSYGGLVYQCIADAAAGGNPPPQVPAKWTRVTAKELSRYGIVTPVIDDGTTFAAVDYIHISTITEYQDGDVIDQCPGIDCEVFKGPIPGYGEGYTVVPPDSSSMSPIYCDLNGYFVPSLNASTFKYSPGAGEYTMDETTKVLIPAQRVHLIDNAINYIPVSATNVPSFVLEFALPDRKPGVARDIVAVVTGFDFPTGYSPSFWWPASGITWQCKKGASLPAPTSGSHIVLMTEIGQSGNASTFFVASDELETTTPGE